MKKKRESRFSPGKEKRSGKFKRSRVRFMLYWEIRIPVRRYGR